MRITITKYSVLHILFWLSIFLFSLWFMDKSFGVVTSSGHLRIARHEVGDMGLHLSIIRSISLGDNVPLQSPFFPGPPLPYHYGIDLIVGLLERYGMRIDIALNGISAISFLFLCIGVYVLTRAVFPLYPIAAVISVIFVIFHSGTTAFEYIWQQGLVSAITNAWRLPTYIHAGPFDGAIQSIYFTPAVFLNQRHLVVGLSISVWLLYACWSVVVTKKPLSSLSILLLGSFIGMLSKIHSLLFLSTFLVCCCWAIFYKRKDIWISLLCAGFIAVLFHLPLLHVSWKSHQIFVFGFLASSSGSIYSFITYWVANLGLLVVLVPIAFVRATAEQKCFILPFMLLFFLGNCIQFSYRIEHNHSIFNYIVLIFNMFAGSVIASLLYASRRSLIIGMTLCLALVSSGILDMMAVKNDFQLEQDDVSGSELMQWVVTHTHKTSIFLSPQTLLDPITLAGRYTFLGPTYYLDVMGYQYESRNTMVSAFLNNPTTTSVANLRDAGVSYVYIPSVTDDARFTSIEPQIRLILDSAYSGSEGVVYSL